MLQISGTSSAFLAFFLFYLALWQKASETLCFSFSFSVILAQPARHTTALKKVELFTKKMKVHQLFKRKENYSPRQRKFLDCFSINSFHHEA